MKRCLITLTAAMLLVAMVGWTAYAQGGGSSASIVGTLLDQSGGVIPGGEIMLRNEATGAETSTVSAENGTFRFAGLAVGSYTATANLKGFKQAQIKNIVLNAGQPYTLKIVLEVGGSSEVVTIQANAEILQSQSANIQTTLQISQVMGVPAATRNVMDFLVLMPGVSTTGGSRNSTISGMPSTAVNITVDGVTSQDNYLKEGFFSYISPRVDAVQEVTLSTATPGSESSGTGAVQIKFITRSGDNDLHGSLYEYHRDPYFNSNYWFNNRNNAPVYMGEPGKWFPCTTAQMQTEFDKCRAKKDKVIFNQPGGRVGGPIYIPKIFDGRDKAFFFLNYEEFHLPAGMSRSRTIWNPLMESGNYVYLFGSSTIRTVDLLKLAAANGQVSTPDPTVAKMLADIRSSTTCSSCTVQSYPIVSNPTYQTLIYNAPAGQLRQFPTARFDFNLSSKHRLEASWNYSYYDSKPDQLNNYDPRYPGFPWSGSQTSNRFSSSIALRSTLTPRIVNEARVGFNGGTVLFGLGINQGTFNNTGFADAGGFAWGIQGVSTFYSGFSPSRRNAPVQVVEDTLSWTRGSHNLSFGGTWFQNGAWTWFQDQVPSLNFGVDSTYDPAYFMFDGTNGPKNFPGATTSQINEAANIYASLTGRITEIGGTAYINEDTDKYTYNGPSIGRARQRQYGFFAQDSWRVNPGLTLTFGARYEFQRPWTPLNNDYTFAGVPEVWGPSGVGNLFKPGSTGGSPTQVYKYVPGSPAYNPDYKTISPSVGFSWSPRYQSGLLSKIFGSGGQSVFRSGFSIAYARQSMSFYDSAFQSNPGGFIDASRNTNLKNLVSGVGSDVWPLLFRQKDRLGPPAFPDSPTFPLQLQITDEIDAFDPNLRTPYTMSWTFGWQRELTRDTAIEIRYVGNKSLQMQTNRNLNEFNIVENGWLQEFYLAQNNLYANIAAGKGKTFAYTGVAGTSPLPITLAYLGGKLDPANPANYTSAVLGSTMAQFLTNSSNVNTYLARTNPDAGSLASSLDNNATRRDNAAAAGLPLNFFRVNPYARGGAYIYYNGGWAKFDSLQIELRRRMSKSLMVQASYVWAKEFTSAIISWRRPMDTNVGSTIPHAFKASWIYELPFGNGKMFMNNHGRLVDGFVGGWEFHGSARIQCCNLLDFGNVNLVGMTDQDLKDMAGLYFDDANKKIYYYPKAVIDESYKAYSYDVNGYTRGTPTGQYVAQGNTVAGCYQIVSGDCSPRHHYFRGPGFMRFDLSVVKRVRFTESMNFELRGEFLNAFNNINFYGASSIGGLSSGQVTSAFTDSSQQQDPGGRLVQFVLRFNF